MVALCALMPGGIGYAQRSPAPLLDVLKVRGQVYLIAGPVSNAVVQIGADGVLVVDTMREQDADALLSEIGKLTGAKPIRYVVNTHAHLDHVGGNAKVSLLARSSSAAIWRSGSGRPRVHRRARESAQRGEREDGRHSLLPFAGWPTDTFFQSEKDLHSTVRASN